VIRITAWCPAGTIASRFHHTVIERLDPYPRTISVPLAWSWRLSDATSEQRAHYEIFGEGTGIRWPDIDEDISVRGMLDGTPARRPPR
jgi:hypothetical protein